MNVFVKTTAKTLLSSSFYRFAIQLLSRQIGIVSIKQVNNDVFELKFGQSCTGPLLLQSYLFDAGRPIYKLDKNKEVNKGKRVLLAYYSTNMEIFVSENI
jgi:hypothetical protein